MNSVASLKNQIEDSPVRRGSLARLALVLWTVLLTAGGLAIVSAICWFVVPPIPHDAAFAARYSVLPRYFYPFQPAKSLAFECCLLAAPVFIFVAVGWGRRFIVRQDAVALGRFVRGALALHLLFFAACIRPLVYYPHPPLWVPPVWLLCPLPFPPPVPAWEWIAGALLAFALGVAVTSGFPAGPVRRWAVRLVLGLAILGAPVEFYASAEVNDDPDIIYHLNALLDAFSQSINGRHLLVDFPHIYGGYGEILAPLLRLFPRTMAVPLLALAVPALLAVWLWLAAAVRLVKNPAVLALTAAGLLAVSYLSALPPNYCYDTPRAFFPALGLVLAAGYLRRPGAARFWAVSVVAALASIWNLDTGLVLELAWTLTLLAGDAAARDWKQAARHGLSQLALLSAAWASFFVYLRLVSHRWPDPGLVFYFQWMVVKSGYFCVALIVPSAWTAVALLYLAGLVVAVLAHLRRRVPWKGRLVLFLALLGTGMFSYYMGRAAESNLIAVSPPGILLAGFLGSEMLARVRRGLLPPIARWFFLPWALMIFWWAFLFFVQMPVIARREWQLLLDGFPVHPTPVQENAAFARAHTHPGESDVYFLSGNSGFYYYLTGTTRPLPTPGNVELLQRRDMDVLIDALQWHEIPKLFVDKNFWFMDMYRNDVYAAITDAMAAQYKPVAISPGGLILEVPRSAGPAATP